jgi:hypothetical protein
MKMKGFFLVGLVLLALLFAGVITIAATISLGEGAVLQAISFVDPAGDPVDNDVAPTGDPVDNDVAPT